MWWYDAAMTRDDILTLGRLARIRMSEAEADNLGTEIDAILGYVSTINDLVTDTSTGPEAGSLKNIFRDDVVTNQPDQYTEVLLTAMPERRGRFLQVKKILGGTE